MTRLDTGQLLALGILEKPVPQTDVPEDRESVDALDDTTWGYIGHERVTEALEDGKVVSASNYYGLPYLWKEGDVYRGTLLQYRAVTENPTFATIDEALEWFESRYHETDG